MVDSGCSDAQTKEELEELKGADLYKFILSHMI